MSNKTNKGHFKKGSIPHNLGKKVEEYVNPEAIERMENTQFKAGKDHEGKNHISWQGGVQHNSVDCVHVWIGNNQRVRRPKMVYEENFGKAPKGYVIFHKDGNKDNDAPDNLEAISRAELLKRNREK